MMEHHDHPAAESIEAVFEHDAMIRTACENWLGKR